MIYSNIRLNLGMTAAPDHYHKVYNNNMYLRFGYSDITSGTHGAFVLFLEPRLQTVHVKQVVAHEIAHTISVYNIETANSTHDLVVVDVIQ